MNRAALSRLALAMVAAGGVGAASAQAAPLHVSPALQRYLDLQPGQSQALQRLQRDWQSELQRAASVAAGKTDAVLCERLRQRLAQVRDSARALLSADQQSRLQRLDEAHALMPLVESAQRAQLMDSELSGAPLPLPEGSIETRFRYLRSAPLQLPGCPAPKDRPYRTQEVDRAASAPHKN